MIPWVSLAGERHAMLSRRLYTGPNPLDTLQHVADHGLSCWRHPEVRGEPGGLLDNLMVIPARWR